MQAGKHAYARKHAYAAKHAYASRQTILFKLGR